MASWLAWLALAVAAPTPLRLPAEVDDAYALRVNPGGLGFATSELRLAYGREAWGDGDLQGLGGYGALRLPGQWVLGAQLGLDFDPDGRSRGLGGLGLGQASRTFGWGVSWLREGRFGATKKDLWLLGASWRPYSWLSTGVAIRDLAQSAQRREWDLGLALRPWQRLTVGARWRLTQSTPLNSDTLDLTFLATVEPFLGMRFGFGIDLDGAITGQLAFDLDHVGAGSSVENVGEGLRLASEVVVRGQTRPSLLPVSGVVVLDLRGELRPEPDFQLLSQSYSVQPATTSLLLKYLTSNHRAQALFVRIGPLDVGWGQAKEVRDGLIAFRSTGRRIECFLGASGELPLYLASACDGVIVPPPLLLEADGLVATNLYAGEALARLGVRVQIARRGAYKNSPDQLTERGASLEEREAMGAYLSDVNAELRGALAEGRSTKIEAVDALFARRTLTSSEAIASGWIDHALYPDQLEDHLHQVFGGARLISPGDLGRGATAWGERPQIAVISLDATISGGESEVLPFGLGRSVGAETVLAALEQARTSPSIKAVVLRVDSPGGDAYASDFIARGVAQLAQEKVVIASFGDIAASGGYYAAAPAHVIYAEPTTLTGSIGVFSVRVSAEGLLRRLGVAPEVLAPQGAEASGMLFDPSPAEQDAQARQVEAIYARFIEVVAKGRRLDPDAVRKVAEGRIWSGKAALAHGLVDALGGLSDALARAQKEAGLAADAPVELIFLPGPKWQLPEALRVLGAEARKQPLIDKWGQNAAALWLALRGADQGLLAFEPSLGVD